MTELDVDVSIGGAVAVTVLDTTTGQKIATGKVALAGWSLRTTSTQNAQQLSGNQNAPAALTTIVALVVPAGTWTLTWEVEVNGTTGAAEVNNFELLQGGTVLMTSENGSTAAQPYPQTSVQVTTTGAATTIAIKNIAAATAGTNYVAQLEIAPGGATAAAEFTSGGNSVAEVSIPVGQSDTHWFGSGGIELQSDLTLNVLSGTMRGAVYVRLELPHLTIYPRGHHVCCAHYGTWDCRTCDHRFGYRLGQGVPAHIRYQRACSA